MHQSELDPNEEIIEQLEEEESYKDDLAEVPPNDIVAYNELRSCADLLRMYQSGQLEVQPDFQRDIVWQSPAQTRFIDSLTKQLPIPSMCISLDYKTDKRLVIDGLQRMTSIINFLSNDEWKLSNLDDIDARISGKTVHTIKTKEKDIFERVQNVTIPVTVLRCDYSKQSHNDYLFTIFHRLNTGGNKLNNQEIRNCIYNGAFNDLLKRLVQHPSWIKLMGLKPKGIYRFSNEELILRFFAFNEKLEQYNGRLAKFLNDYMHANRNPNSDFIAEKETLFNSTMQIVFEKIFDGQTAPKMSKATWEGVLVGVSRNIPVLNGMPSFDIKGRYNNYRHLTEFSSESLKEGLSAKEKVRARLHSAINVFSVIQ